MNVDYNVKLKKITNNIISGSLNDRISEYYKYNDDDFLFIFFVYLFLFHGKIEYFDEIKYNEIDDKIAYLEDTQNVKIRKTNLDDDWYKKDYGNFIGYYKENNTPVIICRKLFGYYIFDSNTNKYTKIDKKVAKKIKNEGIFISKLFGKNDKNGLKILFKYIYEEKIDILKFLFYSLIVSFVTIIVNHITSKIINEYIRIQAFRIVFLSCLNMFLFIIAGFIVNIIITRIKVNVQTKVNSKIFSGLLFRLMHLPVNEEKKIAHNLIGLIISFNAAIDNIVGSFITIFIFFFQCLFIFLKINSMSFTKAPLYFLMVVFLFIILFLQIKVFDRVVNKQKQDNIMMKFQTEILSCEETIKNNAIEDIIDYLYALRYNGYNSSNYALENLNQYNTIIINVFNNVSIYVVFLIAYFMFAGDETIAIVMLFPLFTNYLLNLITALSEIFKSIPYIDFANMILDKPVEKNGIEGIRREISGDIEFNNVNFAYDGSDNYIIKNLNLKIKAGEYIGIVGSSGCGKSTLIKLLLGFEKPVTGNIYFDGINFESYNVMDIRRQFGVCLQKPEVITASIKDNIAMSKDADMDKVKKAAENASILDEIEAMPMKFETILISEANTISGGQKQRIVLARAFMNNPKILILDEATSAMDNITQLKIKENIEKLGITCISIAHRLSTIENCDRILYMDNGKIVEEGNYKELMEKNGLFAKMAKRNII